MENSKNTRSYEAADDSLLHIVWRQKGLIVLTIALALGCAGIYLLVKPKVYTAAERIQVQRALPMANDRQQASSDNNGESFVYQEAELIKSAPVLYTALGGPGMDELSIFENVKNTLAFLKREVNVEVGRRDSFITVSLAYKNGDEAAKVVDNIIESYRAFKSKQRRDMASNVLTLLENDKKKTDADLASKYEEIQKFKEANPSFAFTNDKTNYIIQRTNSLSDELTKAHIETINLKTAYESALKSIQDDPDAIKSLDKDGGVILSQQDEELLRAELFTRKQELAERRRIYLPDHPIIKTLEARIKQLNISYVGSAKLRWEASQEREKELQKSFDDQQAVAMDLSKKAAEYDRLQKEVATLQKHSDDLDSRIKEVTLTIDAGAMTVTVVDPVNWEDQPVRPIKAQVFGIGAGVGLILGLMLAVMREWMHPKLRSEAEVKTSIGVPVLGAIPHFPGASWPEALGWAVHLDPTSDAAEAYRAVRTSVQFGTDGAARTLVITSPSPRDGKSTLASNLAIAMAKAGKTVLIIDADFRAPSQHRIFGVSGEIGFSSVLEAGEMVERAIRRTTVEGLHVIPAGPSVSSPSELLNSPVMGEILDDLTKQYDHVVIDTPPVLRVDDARIVAASCDSTVLVLRSDKISRRLAEEARDRLLAVGARLLGVVLNDISGAGGGGFGKLSELVRGESRETETRPDDAVHHAQVRPVSGSGRVI